MTTEPTDLTALQMVAAYTSGELSPVDVTVAALAAIAERDADVNAAQIDGMPYWRIFVSVILPLSAPALLAVGVLQFIQIWDDLLVALIFLQQPAVRTITVGLDTTLDDATRYICSLEIIKVQLQIWMVKDEELQTQREAVQCFAA